MIATIRAILAGLCIASGTAAAAEQLVVVELYTSQGCSSCPPADRMMDDLARRSDVLPLSLHVDYWDYIGWKDEFADPRFTLRQKSYARVVGERMIYTPQMVIDGQARVVGSRGSEVLGALQRHLAQPSPVDVSVSRSGGSVRVQAAATGGASLPGALIVQLVQYSPSEHVDIRGGENEGRSFTYVNVVRDWQVIGEWDGHGTWQGDAPVQGPAAVIVQEKGPGVILGAARID